jgi:elongation factor G
MHVLSIALKPDTQADAEKLRHGLGALMAEDRTFRAQDDERTGETVISGVSELHLEIILDRLKREFDLNARVGKPRIAYKEMLTRAADGEGRYIKQTGDRGHYGHAKIRLMPRKPGEGYEFVNAITVAAIPPQYITPIDQGIREALTTGVLAGYPIDDVRVELYDGSYHDADSDEIAFRIAGAMACKDAARKAGPALLEPVMRVEVVTPEEFLGDIIADLNRRGGILQSLDTRDAMQILTMRVALSELFGYASDLRSLTEGRATYSMSFAHYQQARRGPDSFDDDRISPVYAPRNPSPTINDSSIALPEPHDNGRQ